MQLIETSPATFAGSCSDDLILSKLYLASVLQELGHTQFNKIYNLGSWYGTLAPILQHQGIEFKQFVNVDRNPDLVKKAQAVSKYFGLDDITKHLTGDANFLRYKQPSLIINCSCNNIDDVEWFNRIPSGTLVALQTRDNPKFKISFPLTETLHYSKLKLKDPTTKYTRVTKVGIK